MKKFVTTVMMAMVVTLAAKADFLYFQASAFDWEGPKLFDYAMIGVAYDGETEWDGSGNKTYLQIQTTAAAGASSSDAIMADDVDPERYYATGWAQILSDYMDDEYTFYVETYEFGEDELTPDKQIWGYDEDSAKTYAELLKDNHIYKPGSTDPQNVTAWVVPEPTSAMLMLFALAGLALKRKSVR